MAKTKTDDALGEFEGNPIARSSVKITKAGDGLSDALKVDPVVLHRGDEVYFVLRGKVRYVAHPPEKKDSVAVVRQHIIDTEDIAIVQEAEVAKLLEANRDRVQRALDSLAGQMKIGDPEDHQWTPFSQDDLGCIECGEVEDKPWHSAEAREAVPALSN